MRKILFAFVAVFLLSAQPAWADRAEDCRGMKNGGAVLIGIAEIINEKIDQVKKDVNDPARGEKLNILRGQFRYIQNLFSQLRVKYTTPPPCGKDFEDDLGQTFPPMRINK